MRKIIVFLVLICSLSAYAQSASKVNNAQNVWTVEHDPAVLLECDPILSGLFKPRIKDSIHWETYNINGLENFINNKGDIRYKPISYTPSNSEVLSAIGFTPYNSTNPNGYISSYTETDPIWTAISSSYRTKVQNDLLYQPIGSYLTSESDPTVPSYAKSLTAFSVIKTNTDLLYEPLFSKNTAFNKNFGTIVGTITEGNDSRVLNGATAFSWGNHALAGYLTSFTESDPTVPAYSKSLTGFSIIKTSTDPLYRPISYVPSWSDITSKPTTIAGFGITDFNSLGDARWSLLGHTHTFSSLTSKPTTLSGYGITDAYPLTGNPSNFLTANQTITLSGDTSGSGTTAITTTLASVGTAGTYGIVTTDIKGRVTSGKRAETYSGVSNGSGNYTIVFGVAYSAAPNIQVCLINPNVRDTPIVTVSTTGFTVNIQRRTDALGLLPTYSNVVGGVIDVLITEK